jgi:hypothetical protein
MSQIALGGFAALVYMRFTGAQIPDWFQVAVVGNTACWFASVWPESVRNVGAVSKQ